MKTNQITIHAIEISKQAEYGLNIHTFFPSVYCAEYRATLQGNVLTVQHKQYDYIVRSFALSYDMGPALSQLFINSDNQTKIYRIIQRIVQLKALQLVKEVNKGI